MAATRATVLARRLTSDVAIAVRLVITRRDSRIVATLVAAAYLLAFLWMTGDLTIRTDVLPGLLVVTDPLGRMLTRTGPASFDAIAVIDTGLVRLLFSPINVLVGATIATLVGITISVSYLAVRQPAACGLRAGSGVLASLPALLSGTLCCGPVVLLAIGVQASAALMTAFTWALPFGFVLLVVSLAFVAGRIDPSAANVGTDASEPLGK